MRLRAQNRIVTGALLLLLLLVVIGSLLTSAPPARATETFRLDVRTPPVGMATDHERARYWLLDRASGRLSLTALGADGAVQGHMTSRDNLVAGAGLAYDAGELYVGDVGGARRQVTIYQVVEPWPGTDILKAVPLVLTYPDGPREGTAILLGPDGRLFVVTAGDAPGIYAAPAAPSATGPNALERVADAPAGVTDGVVLPNGRWVLRTATTVISLDPDTRAPLGETAIGVEERGQVITAQLGGGAVLTALGPAGAVTSTTNPGPPPRTATPAPIRTRAAAPRTVTPQQEEPNRTIEQTGTNVAIGAAAVLAVLAGLVVLVRR